MPKFTCLALVLFVAFSLNLHAKESDKGTAYFAQSVTELKALLPNPPADGSPETLKEIELILEKQKTRTPEEVARIREEVHLKVDLFENVTGSWFKLKELPATKTLFLNVDATLYPIIVSAKDAWGRPRPFLQDKRVKPPIELPTNPSYPSGHSTFGNLNAMVLAELAPDLKDVILARGKQIGDDRVIGGVHFPSDVAAGQILAKDLFAKLMANPAFQVDLAKAKTEVAAARAKG